MSRLLFLASLCLSLIGQAHAYGPADAYAEAGADLGALVPVFAGIVLGIAAIWVAFGIAIKYIKKIIGGS